jgi:WD40 repeat protein/tRNA A-37 threonylcarbamoyl transferase component Bud32
MPLDATTTFDRDAQLDEVVTAYLKETRAGKTPDPAAWQARYPELAADLAEFFADRAALERLAGPLRTVAQDVPTTVGEDYEILQEIAHGGMGIVYKARQKSLNRVVALKMVQPGRAAEDGDRFRREAEAAAHLDHPHIVPIYEVGEAGGRPFFSMKFIDGVDLGQWMHSEPRPSGSAERHRSLTLAARILATVARTVHHAHQRGILHRDLKPSNILLERRAGVVNPLVPYVADFGLAKRVEGDSAVTHSGAIIGTPSYMAPEQAAAAPTLTTAVDIYGLGAIVYEALTGQPPFRAETPLETLVQVRTQEPPRPRALHPNADRDLETICLKCLEKDPAHRYGSAEALADDLERWLGGEPIRARRAGTWERALKWAKRRPAVAALVGSMVVFVLCSFGFLIWGWENALDAEQAADGRAGAEENQRKAEAKARIAAHNEAMAAQAKAAVELQARNAADRQARIHEARLALERGTNRCERGDIAGGVLWLVRGLEVAPADDAELQWSLRNLLGAWKNEICPLQAILPHEGTVLGAVWSPNNKTILTKSTKAPRPMDRDADWVDLGADRPGVDPARRDDVVLQLWDVATAGRKGQALTGHRGWVAAMTFSPDSKMVLTGGNDGTARLWDAATGKPIGSPLQHEGMELVPEPVCSVQFSPDGKSMVTGTAFGMVLRGNRLGRTARLWDTATGKIRFRTPPPEHYPKWPPPACKAGFSPDGKMFWSEIYGVLQLWETATGKAVGKPIPGGRGSALDGAALCPDGKTVLTYSAHKVHRWETATGKQVGTPVPVGAVDCSDFSLPGRFWHPTALLLTAPIPMAGSRESFEPPACSEARLFDWHSGKLLPGKLEHDGRILAATFGAGPGVLTASADRTARVWDKSGRLLAAPLRHQGWVRAVASRWDGDRDTIMTAGDTTVRLWAAPRQPSPVSVYSQNADVLDRARAPGGLFTQDGDVCRAITPDGKVLVSFNLKTQNMRFWDAASLKPLCDPIPHRHGCNDASLNIAFSADGKTMLTSDFNRLHRWDLATLKLIGTPVRDDWHPSGTLSRISLDGKCFLSWAGDGYDLRLFDTATGKPFGDAWPNGGDTLGGRGFFDTLSPNGKTVLIGASTLVNGRIARTEVRLRHTLTGKTIGAPLPLQRQLSAGAFSPDGKIVVTGSGHQARVWDAATARPLGDPMEAPRGHIINDLLFSPDGRTLRMVSTERGAWWSSDNRAVRFWDVATHKPLGSARHTMEGFNTRLPPGPSQGEIFMPDSSAILQASSLTRTPVPRPWQKSVARIRLWAEVNTGQALDSGGAIVDLDARTWRANWDRLRKLGGAP